MQYKKLQNQCDSTLTNSYVKIAHIAAIIVEAYLRNICGAMKQNESELKHIFLVFY